MENAPWQKRAKRAGLSQRMLARLLGFTEVTVSRQLRGAWESGVPQHVKAAIIAWEMFTPDQRDAWQAALEREAAGKRKTAKAKQKKRADRVATKAAS